MLAFSSRIGRLLADKADYVLLLDVHGTVSQGRPAADATVIVTHLRGGQYRLPLGADHVARIVGRMAGRGDVVLTMGTGDVTGYGAAILDALSQRSEVALSA